MSHRDKPNVREYFSLHCTVPYYFYPLCPLRLRFGGSPVSIMRLFTYLFFTLPTKPDNGRKTNIRPIVDSEDWKWTAAASIIHHQSSTKWCFARRLSADKYACPSHLIIYLCADMIVFIDQYLCCRQQYLMRIHLFYSRPYTYITCKRIAHSSLWLQNYWHIYRPTLQQVMHIWATQAYILVLCYHAHARFTSQPNVTSRFLTRDLICAVMTLTFDFSDCANSP